MGKKNLAVDITEKASDTKFVDCEIGGKVRNSGKRTTFIRTKISLFKREHPILFWLGVIASIITIISFLPNILSYSYHVPFNSNDITKNVEIICYLGNRKTISGQASGLTFTKNEFDSNGNFIDYEKNSDMQSVCGISETEINTIIKRVSQGESAPTLLKVILNK